MELDQHSSNLHSTHQGSTAKGTLEELKELQLQCDFLEDRCDYKVDRIRAFHMGYCEPYFAKRSRILDGENEKAIRFPKFWVTALKEASKELCAEITDLDEKALEYLRDIKYTALLDEPKGWKLDFVFDSSSNPYFENAILTKEARYSMFRGRRIYEELKGTEIKWYPGKCLRQKVVKRMGKRYLVDANTFFDLFMGSEYYGLNPGERTFHTDICHDIIKGVILHPLFFYLRHEFRRGGTTPPKGWHYRISPWNGKNPIEAANSPALIKIWEKCFDTLLSRKGLVELYANEVEIEKLNEDALELMQTVEKDYQVGVEPLYNRRGEIVVPSFWLNAMRGEKTLGRMISDNDAKALRYLRDIKMFMLGESTCWKLEFFFDRNPYFKNPVLTKEMHILSFGGLSEPSHSIGTEIKWRPDGFFEVDNKKPIESFFNLFNGSEDDGYSGRDLERDMDMCAIIMRRIIPHAASFYFDSDHFKGSSKA